MNTLSISSVGFEAARWLGLPVNSSATSRHGHSFRVTATSMAQLPELNHALSEVCSPWQMSDLNDFFSEPSDEIIAQYIAKELHTKLGAPVSIDLRSAPNVGVRLDGEQLSHWLSAEFSAAHFLPSVPEGHQCGRLHGHGFKVKIWSDAHLSTPKQLANAWHLMHGQLHHAYLNHIEGLSNPTSENLTEWLWQRMDSILPMRAIEVFETSTAGSRRDDSGFTIWKELRFEAACPFDTEGRYTGHSYLARLFLHKDTLDAQAGWVRDFADVKSLFKPIYNQLDHYALDTITDLDEYDCHALADWVGQKLKTDVPELSRVEVFESERDGAAVILQTALSKELPHVHG